MTARGERVAVSVHSRPRWVPQLVRRAGGGAAAEHALIVDARRRRLVPVREPLVLITQIGRAGGTLMLRLLDGHPQLHVVPHELGSRLPQRERLLSEAPVAWEALRDARLEEWLDVGFRQPRRSLHGDREAYSLLVPPGIQRALFLSCHGDGVPSERAVMDAYWTSYFNAWLDNRGLHEGVKRWIVGFEPNVVAKARAMQRLQDLYPDGRIVSVLRDPASWWASARRWSPERFGDLETALTAWSASTEAVCELKAVRGDALRVLRFEDLVRRPEPTLAGLASWLGIDLKPTLLTPTFNGLPIPANSSFDVPGDGVSDEPAGRRNVLASDEAARIDEATATLYERALALVDGEA